MAASTQAFQINETRPFESGRCAVPNGRLNGSKIWIDVDNSPHVPLFLPIIRELEKHGVDLILTARDMYQVSELVKFFELPCKVIGGHYGKNKVLKLMGSFLRVAQLFPTASKFPTLALSGGSRAQILACKALGIPTAMMHDYEHSIKTGFIQTDWIIVPEAIPDRAMTKDSGRLLKFPGLKEDVYVLDFRPNPSFLESLDIDANDLVVTLRPPATEAHYHNPESEKLFEAAVELLATKRATKAITLPRNARQKKQLQERWAELISTGRMVIPEKPVNGLDLIWFSDLVISGGGTMNREAAALGVPVYSVFRGKTGALDQYLANSGRMTLIESVEDVCQKILFKRWNRPSRPESSDRPALKCIVDYILGILEGLCPAPRPVIH